MTNSSKIDKVIYTAAKVWFGGLVALLIANAAGFEQGTWAVAALIAGVVLIGACIMYKAAVTGKRYAQGAKTRRADVMPFAFEKETKLD
jgi:hypothetical protein